MSSETSHNERLGVSPGCFHPGWLLARWPDYVRVLAVVTVRGGRGAQECSGCGLEDFDGALGPGGAGKFLVAGEQCDVHGFGECYIGGVIDGEVVP